MQPIRDGRTGISKIPINSGHVIVKLARYFDLHDLNSYKSLLLHYADDEINVSEIVFSEPYSY